NVFYDGANDQLYAGDYSNNRVLVFNMSGGITSAMNSSDVLGQLDDGDSPVFTTQVSNLYPNRRGLFNPWFASIDAVGHRLFLADFNNNRVVVYNLDSTNQISSRAMSNVLGQPNFRSNTSISSQTGLGLPAASSYDAVNSRLFVTDYGNQRILVYN